jgi:hypothetical protein
MQRVLVKPMICKQTATKQSLSVAGRCIPQEVIPRRAVAYFMCVSAASLWSAQPAEAYGGQKQLAALDQGTVAGCSVEHA